MTAAFSFLFVLGFSLIATKIATTALVHTGVSRALAQFQARSVLSGTGFTTDEAEKVVRHPVRRRIVSGLMVFRNAGFVTAVTSLILSFVDIETNADGLVRIALLAGGVGLLWLLASSDWVDRHLSRLIRAALDRWTGISARDYEDLLNLHGDFRIYELTVRDGDWLAGRTLEDLELPKEGVNVLGIHRQDGRYVGVPRGSTELRANDRVLLYGRSERLRALDDREATAKGHREREAAEREHDRHMDEQDRAENGDAAPAEARG